MRPVDERLADGMEDIATDGRDAGLAAIDATSGVAGRAAQRVGKTVQDVGSIASGAIMAGAKTGINIGKSAGRAAARGATAIDRNLMSTLRHGRYQNPPRLQDPEDFIDTCLPDDGDGATTTAVATKTLSTFAYIGRCLVALFVIGILLVEMAEVVAGIDIRGFGMGAGPRADGAADLGSGAMGVLPKALQRMDATNFIDPRAWLTILLVVVFGLIFVYASLKAFAEVTNTYKYCRSYGVWPFDVVQLVPQNITQVFMPFIEAKITFRLFYLFIKFVMSLITLGAEFTEGEGGLAGVQLKGQQILGQYEAELRNGVAGAQELLRKSSLSDLQLLDDILEEASTSTSQ